MKGIDLMEFYISKFKYHLYKLLSKLYPQKKFNVKAEKHKKLSEKYRKRSQYERLLRTNKRYNFSGNMRHRGLMPGHFMKEEKEVDIIVPVFKGLHETQDCIRSVLKTLPQWAKLIVIDDASPDVSLSDWLRDQAKADNFTLIIHAENKGFVETVNEGMALSPAKDVVLLNSDTEVANDWLERMRFAAYSMEKIASVTPFSNYATICSFPNFCRDDNELPGVLCVEEIDGIFSKFSKNDELIEVPSGVGFCMYLRRDCLNEVGPFDEKNFGRGYGEENDWCQRAMKRGWVNCHQLNVFVYHKGSVSFGEEQNLRRKKAMKIMDKLHPLYMAGVKHFCSIDPAREARTMILLDIITRMKIPRILLISHSLGGGVDQHIKELSAFFKDEAHFALLKPTDNGFELHLLMRGNFISETMIIGADDFLRLFSILKCMSINYIHYHHVIGFDDALDCILSLPWRLSCSYDITVHDYYLMNGSTAKLTDASGLYVGDDKMLKNYRSSEEFKTPFELSREEWRKFINRWLRGANRVIFPSSDIFQRFAKAIPEVTANAVVAWHPDYERNTPYPAPVWNRRRGENLKVLVLGGISIEKGVGLLYDVAMSLRGSKIEFHVVGTTYRDMPQTVTVYGSYDNSEVGEKIAKVSPAVVWFPSRCPESYCYTLSIALENALPIIAPNFGSFTERLAGRPLTRIVDWKVNHEEMKNIFLNLERNGQDFLGTGVPVMKGDFATRKENFYRDFYIQGIN
jgi:GT2 family glycosyltransferase